MELVSSSVRRSINKAFLKEPVDRPAFEAFTSALEELMRGIEAAEAKEEREEHFKFLLPPFFKAVGFEGYSINTSSTIDLAISTGRQAADPVGVLMEVKRPSNQAEMISREHLNRKAMHEAVLYYLEQRIGRGNTDLKHIIITDMQQWFFFDAQEFERLFFRPSGLRNAYHDWKEKRKVSASTAFMYDEIAAFIDRSEQHIRGIYLPLPPVAKLLKGKKGSDYEKRLISLFKLFSPVHLLKEPFANDSNSLNKAFYAELLYILGLEETREKNARYIQRAAPERRQRGSIIENTIRILEGEDVLSTVKNLRSSYGSRRADQLFGVAMELGITWMNRILFLKLLEAQLFRYHRKDKRFRFLNYEVIDGLDELNKLFFQVLARKEADRPEDITEKFGHIPFLNSSLFELSALERNSMRINNLDDHAEMPVYAKSVLTEARGKHLNTLDYLFRFLDAYDFSAEGSEEIREERKSLINASVLGLIFEKINGYKDGSFYTPGFITEYMARETLRKAVAEALSDKAGAAPADFTQIHNRIGREMSVEEANRRINAITICDPAVGSGHFLVSCLNEMIALKSELGILCDTDGKVLRGLEVSVENDELIIGWEEEELFEYEVGHTWRGTRLTARRVAPDKERVQKALFHEKRHLIENCLFGVDINSNSVKICRLRLWIELLKRAYYKKERDYMELEVLPNIDINIKQGNSLVSRFGLDADLGAVFRNSAHSLEDYKAAVRAYKHSGERGEKQRLQQLINEIKGEYAITLTQNRPINKKLSKARGQLALMQDDDLFGDIKFSKKDVAQQQKKVKQLEAQKAEEESGAFYQQAFEWRFEFPEVLDEEGRFSGFDVVIGNPPYVRHEAFKDLKPYLQQRYGVYQGTADLYSYFIELGMDVLRQGGNFHYIVANKWMRANYGKALRKWMQREVNIDAIYDFGDLPVFDEATTYPCLLQLSRSAPSASFQAANIDTLEFSTLDNYLHEHRFTSDQHRLKSDGWALIEEAAQRLLDKLKNNGQPLGEYVDGKIYRGVLTGLNEAFVIDEDTKTRLEAEDPNSADIIKPFLAGKDVKRYQIPEVKKYLILIPSGWTDEQTDEANKWSWFQNAYPAVATYLSQFEEKARKRYDKGKYWWELRACGYYDEFEKPKIIVPAIVKSANYVLVSYKNYSNDKTTVIGVDDKYLLGILNSKVSDFTIFNISSTKQNGYYEYKPMYIKDIPIITPPDKTRAEIESLVNHILHKKSQNPEADTREEEARIDALVYELYGLNEEEIAIVEHS
ncbi:MAG: class I SAM-dependent DNA methyltransferase [Cyclonatronaceae bacterium]